ncbi:MAG: PAS domain S-box protein [Elusimicrobiales bacterium]
MDKQKGFLEESLAQSQGKDVCRALFDGSPDAIFLADPGTGIIVDANEAAERLLGRPIQEIIGLHQTALHPPKREKVSRRIFQEHSASDGETIYGGPESHYALRADGTEVPIEITAKIIKIKGRKVLQGFFRDVSSRKQAEEALRESEERYRTLVNHAPVGIVVHRAGTMKFVNSKLAEIGGIPDPAALVGKSIMEFIHPASRATAVARLTELTRAGAPLGPSEYQLVAPDGRVLDMEMQSLPITYEGEDCIISIIQDVTARKLAQQALRESEERYRTLVDNAPVGIVVHAAGVMRFVNSRIAEIVRVPDRAALVGRNVLEFMHPGSQNLAGDRILKAMADGLPLPAAEERLVSADGAVVDVETTSVPLVYRGERCLMAIVQDITPRKLAESELKAAHDQLLEAKARLEERVTERTAQLEELNKELEAFSYSAAHDLKAPLRRINVFSDMLQKEAAPVLKDDTREYLANIQKSVNQMTRLVDGLLSLSTTGRRPLDLETVSLTALLEEAITEVKTENPGRAIEWNFQPLPVVKCDKAMLRQVFINLLGNAAKYSRGSSPARVEITCSGTQREHVIGVRDNGVGFDMEYAGKLFGVFQRLHRSEEFEGTGIGLSTVKRIITRHGGRVWAEAEAGKGAVFYFSLPGK